MQIADAPGRNEPGTGKLDIDRYLDRIYATGYDGWVGPRVQAERGQRGLLRLAAPRAARGRTAS